MDLDKVNVLLLLDALLDELVMQQFVFGIDIHLRLAQFVTKNHGHNFTLEEWKYRLAALICHSEEDQKKFYATFDNFIKKEEQKAVELEKEIKDDKLLEKQEKIEEEPTPIENLKQQQKPQHKPQPAATTGRSGPIRIELRFPQNDLRIWNTSEIDKAVRPLLEKEWSYVSDWDIPLSIKATIRNGGLPTFHRRRRKTTPQYILLIDQKSPRDHLAGLYADLGAELRRRDVAVEWFFYDHIPYRCWRDRREPSSFTNVERLATEFDGAKLLIVGEPNGLLALPDLRPSNRTLDLVDNFKEVALLCNRSTAQWTNAELALCQLFPVVPATAAGIVTLVAQWDAPSVWTPDFWKTVHQEVYVPSVEAATGDDEDDFEDMMDNLRFYLGKAGYTWLCAAAVYPDIYYELTALLNDESIIPDTSLTEWAQNSVWFTALLRLSRIRWFRDGAIPNSVRQRLRGALPPSQAKEVRRQLLEILDLDANHPRPDSYAAANRTYTMAWYTHEQKVLDPSVSNAQKEQLDADFYKNNTTVQLSDIEDAIGRAFFTHIQPPVEQTQTGEGMDYSNATSPDENIFIYPQAPSDETKFYILWIDDNPQNKDAAVTASEIANNWREQYQNIDITKALSTTEALEKIQQNYYDIIITNLRRPEGAYAGGDLMASLKSKGYHKPYAFYTAEAQYEEEKAKMQEAGAGIATVWVSELENWMLQIKNEKFPLEQDIPKPEEPKPEDPKPTTQYYGGMNKSEFIQTVRQFIADGKTDEALSLMRSKMQDFDPSIVTDVVLLESRYQNARTDYLVKGILPKEDYERTTAQVNYAMLEILEKIEKTPIVPIPPKQTRGRILHRILGVMPIGKENRCIVRIAHNDEEIVKEFKQDDDTTIQDLRIAEVMGVELVDFNETPAYSIRTITETEQFISTDDYTQWLFIVKPLTIGKHPLTLKVSVIESVDGKERKREIVLEKEIMVIEQPVEGQNYG